MQEELRLSEERLSLALDSGSDGLWDWNLTTGEVCLTGQWMTILGYDAAEIAPTFGAWMSLLHPDDVSPARHHLVAHLKGKVDRLECEYRVRMKNGDYAWALARGKVVAREACGRATRMVGTKIDITRRKETERQIEHMVLHDALTGLPNRLLFRERLAQKVSNARRRGYTFAVFACDLDRFKHVNDTRGHAAGDALLVAIGERLSAVVRDTDLVARLGGDEFAIVLGRIDHAAEARIIAKRVIEAIELPMEIEGQSTTVGISVGMRSDAPRTRMPRRAPRMRTSPFTGPRRQGAQPIAATKAACAASDPHGGGADMTMTTSRRRCRRRCRHTVSIWPELDRS